MLPKKRISYFLIILMVLFLGIVSRKINGIPTFIGDTLYAIMIYFGLRFLFLSLSPIKSIFIALLFCYSIEFQQLYRADWILNLRNSTIGHYILGQGFLWSDLGFYTIGVAIAYLMDSVLFKTHNSN
ncbi:DUF2809 domain-containing protein [Flavobacterium sp.]|jgi:hypothetical protein|uniref:DUF2809 domain-containing protein n=1 Tax=Flavobacterium sp. TaxID=239 RepID=UPI0037BF37E9